MFLFWLCKANEWCLGSQMEGTNWVRNVLTTCFVYCGPFFLMFCFNNTVAWTHRVRMVFDACQAPAHAGLTETWSVFCRLRPTKRKVTCERQWWVWQPLGNIGMKEPCDAVGCSLPPRKS